ncbi:MAG: GAF domain-containing protein [Candidatus Firestonebacteria bacterium]
MYEFTFKEVVDVTKWSVVLSKILNFIPPEIPLIWLADSKGEILFEFIREKEVKLCRPPVGADVHNECLNDFNLRILQAVQTQKPLIQHCRKDYLTIAVPMVIGGKVVGILGGCQIPIASGITIESYSNLIPKFQHTATQLLQSVSSEEDGLPAIFRKSIDLFASMSKVLTGFSLFQNSDRIATIQEIGRVVSSTLDLKEVLNAVVNIIVKKMNIDACSIFLFYSDSLELVLEATKGLSENAIGKVKIKIDEGLIGWSARKNQVIAIKNVLFDPRYKPLPHTGDENFVSLLLIPIVDKGELLGVIRMQTLEVYDWTEEERNTLLTIANQVGIAIRNAKLYSTTDNRLKEMSILYEVGKLITSTLNLDELLDRIVRASATVCEAKAATIWLMDPEKKELRNRVEYNFETINDKNFLVTEEIAYEVAIDKKSKSIPSMICVPLISKNKVIGTICVYEKLSRDENIPSVFDSDDIRALEILASQAAISVENARLFENVNEAQKKIKDTHEQLVRSEKLIALGEMAATVAHEIRNPLVAIGGFSKRLLEKKYDKEHSDKYLDIIVREVRRLEKILNEVLQFSRYPNPVFEYKDFLPVIDESMALLSEEYAKRKITISKNITQSFPKIFMDANQMKQVLINILQNAFDAMLSGGEIKINGYIKDENAIIEIIDNGSGIPEEHLKNIFNPFYTTKVGSVGLGLAIISKIIDDHNGKVDVKTEIGKGTTFKLIFPMK